MIKRVQQSPYATNSPTISNRKHEEIKPLGSISLIVGPMFSGKSTELLRCVKRHKIANRKCLVIKYFKDTRYSDKEVVSTHDRQELEACSAFELLPLLAYIQENQVEVVGIDEGQFFPDLTEFVEQCANDHRITVIIAALDGNFKRQSFGKVCELIPMCEEVVKLSAVCKICFQDASFTLRLTNDDSEELIGGSETYMPTCRTCFMSNSQKKNLDKILAATKP